MWHFAGTIMISALVRSFSRLILGLGFVQILLTNDDGIYAPGLAAMEQELQSLGDVCVVAPATEQVAWGIRLLF